jgi:hypothetical protein
MKLIVREICCPGVRPVTVTTPSSDAAAVTPGRSVGTGTTKIVPAGLFKTLAVNPLLVLTGALKTGAGKEEAAELVTCAVPVA